MKITVLGSGCTWTQPLSTSFLINDDFLFDAPQGSFKRMLQMVNFEKIAYVFISHFHSDHFAELHLIIEMCKKTKQKLILFMPQGGKRRLYSMCRLFEVPNLIKYIKKYVRIVTMKDGGFYKDDLYNITFYKMKHSKLLCFGCVFAEQEKNIGFTADTCMCENVHKMLQNVQVAFVDTARTFPDEKHLCVDEVVSLQKTYPKVKIYSVHGSMYSWEQGKNVCDFVKDKQVLVL